MSTFDNAMSKIRQVASIAGKKTGTAVEISKLRLQVVQVNSMIQSTYERIGTLIYEQEKTGTDNYDLVAVCIKEIDALLTQLNEINNKVAELKNGMKCASCGTVNGADMMYCKKCGANLSKKRCEKAEPSPSAFDETNPPEAQQ
ncbi:MAG: hypothetical protein RRY21_04730 [Oscillospiraceae bacterium]